MLNDEVGLGVLSGATVLEMATGDRHKAVQKSNIVCSILGCMCV